MTTELHVTVTAATVPVVAGHRFERPAEDCAEICSCGAAFFDGYNLQAVKVAHLEAHAEIAAAADVDPCAACGLSDVLDAEDTDEVAAHWNTPTGSKIVAWTCSPACSDAVEAMRTPNGTLTPARARHASV